MSFSAKLEFSQLGAHSMFRFASHATKSVRIMARICRSLTAMKSALTDYLTISQDRPVSFTVRMSPERLYRGSISFTGVYKA